MQAYLFVHFREKSTPDGEQVHFALSRDGFNWEEVNGGEPIVWAYHGDKGVRDFTIVRGNEGKTYILATDLSLSYGMRNQYHNSWAGINVHGSKCLSVWESEDLVNWSEQRLVKVADEDYGCVWAPDVIKDKKTGEFIVHWSSSHKSNGYDGKRIYYAKTKDFEHFTTPEVLYEDECGNCIDSAMYEEGGSYYLFVKRENQPIRIKLLKADNPTGPFEKIDKFDDCMEVLREGLYEAPTAVKLEDGRWCLFLDHYAIPGNEQGYVPFISEDISTGDFRRSDADFHFPYGFKHGTILPISMEEYERIKAHDFTDKGWS